MPGYSQVENSVQFVSKLLASSKVNVIADKKEREAHIRQCLEKYHAPGASPLEKRDLVEQIVYNVWYLLPYILSSKKFPERLFDEALQNMVLAVIKAIDHFDPSLNTKFVSYLSGWLRDAVSSSALEDSVVRQPATVDKSVAIGLASTSAKRVSKAEEKLENLNSRSKATAGKTHGRPPLQITSAECIADFATNQDIEAIYCSKEILDLVARAVAPDSDVLNEKEKMVISCRFGVFGTGQATLEKVAELFHSRGWRASKEWIFQLERKALAKIRAYLQQWGIEADDCAFSQHYDE